jgi:hypothetical protein
MHCGLKSVFYNYLERHEGLVDYMYTDNKGYVTVGLGMKLHTPKELAKWYKVSRWSLKPEKGARQGTDKAKIEAANIKALVDQDWKAVESIGRKGLAMKLGKNLECTMKKSCADATKLRLSLNGLNQIFTSELNWREKSLQSSRWFHSFRFYPAYAQLVLFDLAWWVPGALVNGATWQNIRFRPLCEACLRFDFVTAAKLCAKFEALPERKKARQVLFTNAARVLYDKITVDPKRTLDALNDVELALPAGKEAWRPPADWQPPQDWACCP